MAHSFEIAANDVDSKARSGRINLEQKAVERPAALVCTGRGAPRHLTHDLFRCAVSNAKAVQISFPDMFSTDALATMEQQKQNLESFCKLEGLVTVCTLRDPIQVLVEPNNDDNSVAINTDGGRKKIKIDQFMSAMRLLQPDIVCCMSDNINANATAKRTRLATDRTLKFLDSAIEERSKTALKGLLFGSVVGGVSEEERIRSATETAARIVDGFLLEGFFGGELAKQRYDLLHKVMEYLPESKPKMLHGTTSPEDVLAAVDAGVDLFDSTYVVTATDLGCALVFPYPGAPNSDAKGPSQLNLWDGLHERANMPIMDGCPCFACTHHTRAYIHHLLNTHEMLASVLLIIHNYQHYFGFFSQLRASIAAGTYPAFKTAFLHARKALC
eukprot:Colp12_sorted_trinity150504_noHs@30032